MPPAVKLAAATCAQPALDPDIIAAEIDSLVPARSVAAATLTVHLARSHGSIVEDLQAALPPAEPGGIS